MTSSSRDIEGSIFLLMSAQKTAYKKIAKHCQAASIHVVVLKDL